MMEFVVAPKRLEKPGEGTVLAVPTTVERRRCDPCRDLRRFTMGVHCATAAYFSLALAGLIENPLPLYGAGRVESAGASGGGVLFVVWWAFMCAVALLKIYARNGNRRPWCCRAARAAFLLWVALSISVFLPGQPGMLWVFGPAMIWVEAVLFVRLCARVADAGRSQEHACGK